MRVVLAKAFYNAAAVSERNDPRSRHSRFAVDRIRSQLMQSVSPGMTALDLGCGAGRFTFALEELGATVFGVDCATIPLEYARKLAKEEGRNCTFTECHLPDLPFGADSFDYVLLADNIVEFSYSDVSFLAREISRVLCNDGFFCLSFKPGKTKSRSLKISHYTVPDKGTFEYHSYPWTTEKVAEVIGSSLSLIKIEEALNGVRWVVFKKARQMDSPDSKHSL